MDVKVKQRLIGALVLGALAIIFVPMIVIGPESRGAADAVDVPITVPDPPEGEFVTREIPLDSLRPAPAAAVDGVTPPDPRDPNALATVDATAGVAPRVDALPEADVAPVAVDAASGRPAPPAASTPADAQPAAVQPAAPVAPAPVAPAPVAPAPVAPAPVAPAAVAAGDFTVTAGTFGSRANADALVARLKSSGLPVFTEPALANGQPATRVKVGPFADRAAAEAARVRTAAISNAPATVTVGNAASVPTGRGAVAAAPASPSSGFAVQLGAFANQSDALALVARARTAGFSAFEQRVPTDSGVLWRVRLGPVADRASADRLRSQAAERLGVSGNVVSHP